jgi:hypothetical protein
VGTEIVASANLACRFGTQIRIGTALSSLGVLCLTPAHPASVVLVDVANNNQDFTTSTVAYTYQRMYLVFLSQLFRDVAHFAALSLITSVDPSTGPLTGGTTVTVGGTNFVSTPANSLCKFGTAAVGASVVVSSTRVTCTAPARPLGDYALEITNNGQDYTAHGVLWTSVSAYKRDKRREGGADRQLRRSGRDHQYHPHDGPHSRRFGGVGGRHGLFALGAADVHVWHTDAAAGHVCGGHTRAVHVQRGRNGRHVPAEGHQQQPGLFFFRCRIRVPISRYDWRV